MASRAVDKWGLTVINPIRFTPRFVMMNVFSIFDLHLKSVTSAVQIASRSKHLHHTLNHETSLLRLQFYANFKFLASAEKLSFKCLCDLLSVS